jgi:Domain of unknown function (DUF222)
MFVYNWDMSERTIDELAALEVSELCDSEIRVAHVELRRMIDRLEAVDARVLASVHQRMIHLGDGSPSAAAWSQAQTGQRLSEARALLQSGLACASLPLVAKAWAQGEISTVSARAICGGRKAGYEDIYATMEADLVGYAADRDFRRLDAMIRHYQGRVDALKGKAPSDRNHLHHSRVGNRWSLGGNLDQLDGTVIDEALNAAIDKPSEGDTRSLAKRRADAMVRICRFFLDHADLPVEGGEVPHVSVVLRWDGTRDGISAMEPDLAITPSDISRLLCESSLSRVIIGPDSIPLDVGRATRHPSKALRRALSVRDHGCRFPGCHRRPSWCHSHHAKPWELDGETKLDNLVLLCSFHHHLVHKPGWRDAFDGITYSVTNPENRLLHSGVVSNS